MATLATRIPEAQSDSPRNYWAEALALLSEDDKFQLSRTLQNKNQLEILKEVLDVTIEKKLMCIQRRWRFTRGDGKVVILRDLFEKIAVWIQKFKDVGDIAIQYDPAHAALPWAAIRFLLSMAIEDVQSFGAMTEGVEKVAMLITRCEVLEQLYSKPGAPGAIGLGALLTRLYAEILTFQIHAIKHYGRNTASKHVLHWTNLN